MIETSPDTVIGKNLNLLREKMGLNQSDLANFLSVPRESISYYENGKRPVPTAHLSKLADLFCINEYEFYEEDIEKQKLNISFAFRADNISAVDLESIAKFKRIVKNYLNIEKSKHDE